MQIPDRKIPEKLYDTVVVGGGVAGLAAAMTAGRMGLQALLLEKAILGGSVAVLEKVTDYPGIEKIGGWELTQTMAGQARDAGCILHDSVEVTGVQRTDDNQFEIACGEGEPLAARSVIVCTGGEPRLLELADEAHYIRRGIHTCAQCAGPRYGGHTVAVAGNSGWAVRAADHLLDLGCTVLYVTKDTEMRGNSSVVDRLLKHEQFRFLGGCHITGLYGQETLEEILVTSLSGGSYQKIPAAGVFVYRGIKPNSSIVAADKDRKGFLLVNENAMTSVSGIFGAGRVVQDNLPIEVMVGDSSRATMAAASWLKAEK
jgi:thioredoxin reductase (NADPH)